MLMTREKRTAQLRINVPESMKERIEEARAESGSKVITLSGWLMDAIEQHLDTIEIKRKRIGAIKAGH